MIKILRNLKKKDMMFLLCAVGLIVCQVWLDLKMPDYTAKLTESVSSGNIFREEILRNGGMMLLCAFGSMCAAIATGWFSSHIAANFSRTLRSKLFDKITGFSDKEMNHFGVPSLITRTTNDVVQMQMVIALGIQTVIKAPILAIWAVMKISSASFEWTLAIVVTVAAMILVIGTVVAICYPKFKIVQTLTDSLNNITRENISGVRVIRAFNAENYQENKFDETNNRIMKTHLFTSHTMGAMMPVVTVCLNGLTMAIYWIGASLMNRAAGMAERVTIIGNMTAFTQYALQVVVAFMMIVAVFVLTPRAMVSANRITEVLETEPSVVYPEEDAPKQGRGELEFKDVSFTYPDASSPCLEHISFHVHPGETFAIIGATGSGKTSVINLIPRFFDCTEGEVLLDGADIRSYGKHQLENLVSVAPQKAILFKGDIKSNITYGQKEEIPDDDPRIARALEISHADFVNDPEVGIHAAVAQGGNNFSGGQKQRLSIARAVFKDAEIVIFDDTFSALDYKTDMLVRRSIREKMQGTTVILVAQRIGTIKDADQILVLEDGRIAGLGKHEDLLENCPVYREIALSQLSKEEL